MCRVDKVMADNHLYLQYTLYYKLQRISQNTICYRRFTLGGFTTQWGDKKRTNGADEKYTVGRILKGISGVLCLIFIL